jgi:hypothetical protein
MRLVLVCATTATVTSKMHTIALKVDLLDLDAMLIELLLRISNGSICG